MKSILLYYIATGPYIQQLYDIFLPSIKYFCPKYKKTIVVLTDQKMPIKWTKQKNVEIEQRYIDHQPWPFVTMIKHVYIYKYTVMTERYKDYDYICYMNANSNCLKKYYTYWNKFYQDLEDYDILMSKHLFWPKYKDLYLDDHYQTYIQGGFFIGKYESVVSFLHEMSVYELCSINDNILPEYHDETLLNKHKTNFRQDYHIKEDNYIIASECDEMPNQIIKITKHQSKKSKVLPLDFLNWPIGS